jgi:rhodanese-related sulfurtransferase
MSIVGYFFLTIAVLLSLYNLIAISRLRKQISETKDSFQSTISWTKEDLRTDISALRNIMKILGAGGRVTPDMVEQGKPFSDMSAAEAEKFIAGAQNAVVIDVRTPSEYQSGHIPGAKLIPLDEIETRYVEIPKAETILVVCQGGTRSAAACEILSQKGFVNLVNIFDGTASWPGKKEIGLTIRPPASATR